MRTDHLLRVGDAADTPWDDGSVHLVVTSPPYPMIEMWDDLFADRDPAVRDALEAGDGDAAFELMHAQLDAVWDEVLRLLAPGAIVCVNVGDATRSVGGEFGRFPNHARVIDALSARGLTPLPDVLWRKPTNRLTKFMGSGTLPPNAYVTLEHEYVLVFRNGAPRSFPPGDEARYESAFFWEERNEWFSDLWEFTGTDQAGTDADRDRTGAFPLELPLRLVRMFSTYGDTVYDPFAGTGTTTLAAMHAGRNSLGCELDGEFVAAFDDRLDGLAADSRERCRERLAAHRAFVREREAAGDPPGYRTEHYDTRVVTEQERRLRLYVVDDVTRIDPERSGTGGAGERDAPDADGSEADGPETSPDHRAYVVDHVPF